MKNIEQYIESEMSDKITRKRNSPLPCMLVLAIGISLLVLLRTAKMGDTLMATCLTIGIICTALGLILTAMNLSGAMTHFVYMPTRSRMKDKKIYLGVADYQHCRDVIASGDTRGLETLQAVTSSNSALRVLAARDKSIALIQAGRYDTGHFEVETPVIQVPGTAVAHLV